MGNLETISPNALKTHYSEPHHQTGLKNCKVASKALHDGRGGEKIVRGGEPYRSEFFSGVSMVLKLSRKKNCDAGTRLRKKFKQIELFSVNLKFH